MKRNKEEYVQAADDIEHAAESYKLYALYSRIYLIRGLIDEHFELLGKVQKLESENFGLKQTVRNFREKQEKFLGNLRW